jgi:hypothetical protein
MTDYNLIIEKSKIDEYEIYKHYITFRIKCNETENNLEYQYKIFTSEEPIKETDTAKELENRMITITEMEWNRIYNKCIEYFKVHKLSSNQEYTTLYTEITYEQIIKNIHRKEYYIAFRIEFNDLEQQYRLITSETSFENNTAKEINDKMTEKTKAEWEQIYETCKTGDGLKTHEDRTEEYFIVYRKVTDDLTIPRKVHRRLSEQYRKIRQEESYIRTNFSNIPKGKALKIIPEESLMDQLEHLEIWNKNMQ